IPDRNVAPLKPAEFAQSLHKSGDPGTPSRRRGYAQEPDGGQLARLLGARRKRPCGTAGHQGDELTALHRADPTQASREYSRSGSCTAAKAAGSCPPWVNRFTSTSRGRPRNVRFTPKSDQISAPQRNVAKCHKQTYAVQQRTQLFDHLVGAGENGGRDVEAERPGGLEIDHQLEFHRLLHRQVGGLLASKNSAGIDAS